jgi:hypothetical protein
LRLGLTLIFVLRHSCALDAEAGEENGNEINGGISANAEINGLPGPA